MFIRPGRVFVVAAACLAVAGCGGAHGGSSLAPSGGTLRPQLNGGAGIALATLYVSGQGAVYAYDLGASGDTVPVTRTTGYYYQAGGPGGVTASIAGVATNSSGDLIIAQNFTNPQGDGNSCDLVYITARTGTAAADATTATCGNHTGTNTPGTAVAITYTGIFQQFSSGGGLSVPRVIPDVSLSPVPSPQPSGGGSDEIDVLMHYQPTGNLALTACDASNTDQYEVDRYQASNSIAPTTFAVGRSQPGYATTTSTAGTITPVSCDSLANGKTQTYRYIGGSTNGAFFVDFDNGGPGTIERYDSSGSKTNSAGIPGQAGPVTVSVNLGTGIGYRAVAGTTGGITTIYRFKAGPGSGLTFVNALGTFTNPVGALAVDNNGTLYVGVNQPNGVTKIKVYGPTKTQSTSPDYVLNNPVRRPNPAASPTARITGIAIAQP
jgi:hypothetical protein